MVKRKAKGKRAKVRVPRVAQPSKEAMAWRDRNPWFGVDEAKTAEVMNLHLELVESGVEANSQEYWDAINNFSYKSDKEDVVNHPKHYTHGGVETIQFILAKQLGFCLGNVVKYVSRAGVKTHNPIEDLKKAQWYLNREIERLEKDKP